MKKPHSRKQTLNQPLQTLDNDDLSRAQGGLSVKVAVGVVWDWLTPDQPFDDGSIGGGGGIRG